jgi:hypothetical protein
MELIKTLPNEILGLLILVTAAGAGFYFTEITEFWLAVATALSLFLIMHIRTHKVLDSRAEEKPSP